MAQIKIPSASNLVDFGVSLLDIFKNKLKSQMDGWDNAKAKVDKAAINFFQKSESDLASVLDIRTFRAELLDYTNNAVDGNVKSMILDIDDLTESLLVKGVYNASISKALAGYWDSYSGVPAIIKVREGGKFTYEFRRTQSSSDGSAITYIAASADIPAKIYIAVIDTNKESIDIRDYIRTVNSDLQDAIVVNVADDDVKELEQTRLLTLDIEKQVSEYWSKNPGEFKMPGRIILDNSGLNRYTLHLDYCTDDCATASYSGSFAPEEKSILIKAYWYQPELKIRTEFADSPRIWKFVINGFNGVERGDDWNDFKNHAKPGDIIRLSRSDNVEFGFMSYKGSESIVTTISPKGCICYSVDFDAKTFTPMIE